MEMDPSSPTMRPFDPFLDTVNIRVRQVSYNADKEQCSTYQYVVYIRSVLYRRGEYLGYTRVGFFIENGYVKKSSLNMVLKNAGRCREWNVLNSGSIPRWVKWRLATEPYAIVKFSDGTQSADFTCLDGMELADWQSFIDTTEITHVRLDLETQLPLGLDRCMDVYFQIKRGIKFLFSTLSGTTASKFSLNHEGTTFLTLKV